jgi:hypothetical protein
MHLVASLWVGAIALATFGLYTSDNGPLWALCAISLGAAVQLSGKAGRKPVIVAHLALLWMAIFGGLLFRDLGGRSFEQLPNERLAILLSLGALFAIALGYRFGYQEPQSRASMSEVRLSRRKLLGAYWISFFATSASGYLAYAYPALTQPLLAFNGVKLLLLYLLCAQTFADRRGFAALVLIVGAELAEGATGYIASYQVPLLVVLAASLSAAKGSLRAAQITAGALIMAIVIWASLVWTAIKVDYRDWLTTEDPAVTAQSSERLNWIWTAVADGIDYPVAFRKMTSRIGYVELYGLALPRMGNAATTYWLDGMTNILMPRLLFPDKPPLDDTKITTEMTGRVFGKGASVSIGFVAQAHSDLGFPLMYVPLFLVGYVLGKTGSYFQAGNCSQSGRDAFMSAALVFKFTYENNIDKALGAFFLSLIVLILIFKFIYKRLEKWATLNSVPVALRHLPSRRPAAPMTR